MCGVIGIYSQNDVSKKLFYGLNSLQHRGQEASGICVFNGEDMILDKGMGLVYDNFDDESFLKLKGNVGIGNPLHYFQGRIDERKQLVHNTCRCHGQQLGKNLADGHGRNDHRYVI